MPKGVKVMSLLYLPEPRSPYCGGKRGKIGRLGQWSNQSFVGLAGSTFSKVLAKAV